MAEIIEWEWRKRLQAWWEEYYADNPIAWLLRRQIEYSARQSLSTKAQELGKALRKAREAKDPDAIQNLALVNASSRQTERFLDFQQRLRARDLLHQHLLQPLKLLWWQF